MNVLIPAAGKGERMGTPKIRMSVKGKLFPENILNTLSLVNRSDETKSFLFSEILFVVRRDDCSFIKNHFSSRNNVKVIVNDLHNSDMLSSIKLGLQNFKSKASVIIIPVDYPLVLEDTYKTIIQNSLSNPDMVIRPLCGSKSGHPVIMPSSLIPKILNSAKKSLNEIIKNSGIKIIDVPVNDEYIHKNINYPEDLYD